MFLSLFSSENTAEWSAQKEAGFRVFCDSEWEYKFHGDHIWHHGGGSEDCWVDIEIGFSVEQPDLLKKLVGKALNKNPFLTEKSIYNLVTNEINSMLQRDMEEYAEAETYYEPYMEDYGDNGEYVLKGFCEKYGLKFISFECDGGESGFMPDDRW